MKFVNDTVKINSFETILIFEFVSFNVDPLVGIAVDQFVPTFEVAEMPRRTLNDLDTK